MSRMSKYLHQRCSHEALEFVGEVPQLNVYGEPSYVAPRTIKCRHEISAKDVQTTDGALVKSTSVYYIDSSAKLRVNDKLDGKAILVLSEYIGSTGRREGWEAYV